MKLFEQANHVHNQLKNFEREHGVGFIFEGHPYVFVWHYTDAVHVTVMRKPFSRWDYEEHFIITPEQEVFSINAVNGKVNDDIKIYPLRTLQHRAALLEYAETFEKYTTNETPPRPLERI